MSRIVSDPKVMFGKPVFAGTRITALHVLRCLATGSSADEITVEYPSITLDDVRSAQAFENE